MLSWLIELAPFAICLVIAGVVGATEDLGALLQRVGVYFATVMAALGLHALVYYPLSAWLIGGVSPRTLFPRRCRGDPHRLLDQQQPGDRAADARGPRPHARQRVVGAAFGLRRDELQQRRDHALRSDHGAVRRSGGRDGAAPRAADFHPVGRVGRQHGNRRNSQLGADHPDAGAEGGPTAGRGGRLGAADRLQHRLHQRPSPFGRQRDGRHASGDPAGRGNGDSSQAVDSVIDNISRTVRRDTTD